MEWTNEDRLALLKFRDIIDSDDIMVKQEIKNKLLNNKFIIHAIHNVELEQKDPDPEDYFGLNIKPYYIIPDVNVDNRNYICYTVSYEDVDRYNDTVKYLNITFVILCYVRDIDDKETGIARHDLLAALLQDEFNYVPFNGGKVKMVSNKESVVDNNYVARTLVFQQRTDNNIVKTINGTPSIINKRFGKS